MNVGGQRALMVIDNNNSRDVVDNDAIAIGDLYQKARGSLVDSVRYSIECGQRLVAKKASTPHGQWLPWLEANADVLGFESRQTAHLLMRGAANVKSTLHLDESNAAAISRQLWGNTNNKKPREIPTLHPDDEQDDATTEDDTPLRLPGEHERQLIYDAATQGVRSVVDAFLSLTRKERDVAWQLINLYDQLGGRPASSEQFIITRVED